jgi:predicted SprT family Zn-dependent metalloprotease
VNLDAARALADDLMWEHGLTARGWRFEFDRAIRRFGACHWRPSCKITLSRVLVAANEEPEVRDTILHEIAHALAGRDAGHGPTWRAKCLEVGARPERCYDTGRVTAPPARYEVACEAHGRLADRVRRPDRHTLNHTHCRRCKAPAIWTDTIAGTVWLPTLQRWIDPDPAAHSQPDPAQERLVAAHDAPRWDLQTITVQPALF